MKVARYWAKGHTEAELPSGKKVPLACWGWSEQSPDEARQRAHEAALRAVRRWLSGESLQQGYGYLDRPPREEIIEEIQDQRGETIATLTRNAYGAVVLNAAHLMFIDVDVPRESVWAVLGRFMRRLAGKSGVDAATRVREKIMDTARAHAAYSFRVYRTRAGFRCAIVNVPVDPLGEESARLFEAFEADPLYVRLCAVQECYRARLTPKPWRCGASRPPHRFPWETPEREQRVRQWDAAYRRHCASFATCAFYEQVGPDGSDPALQALIALHDRLTRATEPLPLA